MTIYDFDKKEILENYTRMTPADIAKYMNDEKFIILSIDDFFQNMEDNGLLADELEERGQTREEFKADLAAGKAPADHESGIYNGCAYVIQYIL